MDSSDVTHPARRRLSALALVAFMGHLAFIVRSSAMIGTERVFTLFDDAQISMRYARSLADGAGLVWNPGEPAVEGYTNFLWTLWMSVVHSLGFSDASTGLPIALSGSICIIATALGAGALAARICESKETCYNPRLAAAAMTLLYFPLTFWTLRGMEVGLVAALTMWGTVWTLDFAFSERRERRRTALALGATMIALILTRPDGAGTVGIWGITLLVAGTPGERVRRMATFATVCAAALALLTAWRVATYGEWVPNTFALKVEGVTTGARLTRGLAFGAASLTRQWAPLALLLAVSLRGSKWRSAPIALPLALAAALMAYSAYVGGDAWEYFRFGNRYTVPVAPLLIAVVAGRLATGLVFGRDAMLALLAAVALVIGAHWASTLTGYSSAGRDAAYMAPVVGVGAVMLGHSLRFGGRYGVHFALAVAALWTSGEAHGRWLLAGGNYGIVEDANSARLGVLLRAATAPNCRIAFVQAGNAPYYSRRPAVDLLGKSDPVIAHTPPQQRFVPGHDRWDYDHSIGSLRPDVVVQLWHAEEEDLSNMIDWGYQQLPNGVWVRLDSACVDRSAMARPWWEPTALDGLDWTAFH